MLKNSLKSLAALLIVTMPSISLAGAVDNFYAKNKIVSIEITSSHWDELRYQEPHGGRCNWGYLGSRYDYFSADKVKVNGITFANVGTKKRSWCGSISSSQPSLAISFDKYDKSLKAKAQEAFGTDSLILNNSLQDPSYIRQCFAYQYFRKVGLPAPLCNFANVSVNGAKVGLYVSIQPLNKDFLQRSFGTSSGNVYEIEGEDFYDWALERLANNREGGSDASLNDVKGVIASLEHNDFTDLARRVDLDRFLGYWSAEILLLHWDGLSLGNNNSYLFFPQGGKMSVLPWGTDQILNYKSDRESRQLYANNRLSKVLIQSPYYRGLIEDRIRKDLNGIWHEDQLKKEIDDAAAAIKWNVPSSGVGNFNQHVAAIKKNIGDRRNQIASFVSGINGGDPAGDVWHDPGNPSITYPYCSSSAVDPDGDSWGWENNQSCKVKNGGDPAGDVWHDPGNPSITYPYCSSSAVDPDGDSWGWENNQSCKVRS